MTKVTRRQFIRMATAMGGTALFAGCGLLHDHGPVPEYINGAPGVDPLETLKGIRNAYTICGLCPGNCGICCRVAEGSVVKIGGSPFNPISVATPLPFSTSLEEAATVGGSVCAVGGSGIQTLYNPFRVAKPLKRIGPRGSAKWQAITWKQVINEIVQGGNLFSEGNVKGLEHLKKTKGGLSFLAGRADWGSLTFIKKFVASFPGAALLQARSALLEEIAVAAGDSVFGQGTGSVTADYSRARFLLSFGDAPLDSGTPLVSIARQIADARIHGRLRWAVVDPRLSTSASKSDLWVPVMPGTDVNLALAVMKALVDHYPDAVKVPLDAVNNMVKGLTLKGLAASCGISPDIPVHLAKMLASAGQDSAVIAGRGILSQPNGLEAATAILSLNRVVGSTPGSGGLAVRHDDFLKPAEQKLLGETKASLKPKVLGEKCEALMIWQSDPVYDDPRAGTFLKDRLKVPLLVAISTEITETAALADYILPDTTYLERWDICRSPSSATEPGIGMRSPVVGGFDKKTGRYFPILAQTKPMEEILFGVASNLKLPAFETGSSKDPMTAWAYYKEAISTVLDAMKTDGFPVSGSSKHVVQALERGGVFAERPIRRASETSTQSSDFNPMSLKALSPSKAATSGALTLITYTLPFHRSPDSGLNSWLLEVLPENRLIISTQDARANGIHQGDPVTVKTVDGKSVFKSSAQIMPGIRTGVVALARGFGYRESGVTPQSIDGIATGTDPTRGAGVNPSDLSSEAGAVQVMVTKG